MGCEDFFETSHVSFSMPQINVITSKKGDDSYSCNKQMSIFKKIKLYYTLV